MRKRRRHLLKRLQLVTVILSLANLACLLGQLFLAVLYKIFLQKGSWFRPHKDLNLGIEELDWPCIAKTSELRSLGAVDDCLGRLTRISRLH